MTDPVEPVRVDPHLPVNLEFRAALLVAFTLLLIAASALYLLYARGAFEPTQRLVLIADDSEGVSVGMNLTFSGFPIGRVRSIELGEDGNARILIDVPKKDARWLRESSVFTLVRGLVGGVHIRAYSGVMTAPPLPAGAERKVLVGDATAEAQRVLSQARDFVEQLSALAREDGALGGLLENLRATTTRLNGPRGGLAVLTGNEADARRIMETLERTNALLVRLDRLAANADAQVFGTEGKPGAVGEARAAINQLNALLADARNSLKKVDAVLVEAQAVGANARAATSDLGALRAEVDASLRKIDGLINEINRKWPFARDTEIKLP